MKMLFISHLFPNSTAPATGVFVREKAVALSKLTECTIVAPVSWFPFLRPKHVVPELEEYNGVQIFHPKYLALPGFVFNHRWRTYYSMLKHFVMQKELRPDVINVEWVYPDAFAAAGIARELKAKLVVTVHGHAAIGYFGPRPARAVYEKTLQLADTVICVSEELKTRVVKEYSVPENRVRMIGNGVDPEKFPLLERKSVRDELKISFEKKMIVAVCRLSQEKDLSALIKAVSLMRNTDSVLYIIGEGPERGILQTMINRMMLKARVVLTGNVSHKTIHKWLCAADVFCLPSLHEGAPVSIYESLACGVPVVASNVGGIPDILCSDDYGSLCEPGAPDKLAGLLDNALEKNWDKARISGYGRQFTWDNIARQIIQFVEQTS